MTKEYEEGEESPQDFVALQKERKSSQSPLNDAELNEQSPSLHKPSYFQQSQEKNTSQSHQQYKKSTPQPSHTQQFSYEPSRVAQLSQQQQSQSQQKSSSSSPGLRYRTKKQMRKLTNFSLEFQEKEVREFYFQLFEQWPKGIFNAVLAVKIALAGWFTVTEALFFKNVIATVLSVFACALLLLLWKVGRRYKNHQLAVFRVAHVLLSFIMYLVILQLTKNFDEYDTSINSLTSASKTSLTAFSSIVFSIYQVIAIQLEVKWFFKGILFFFIILQNVISLMEFDLFSWFYGLIAFTLFLIILYKHEVAKKKSGFRFYGIAEDFDSLKTLINDILPMQIFIVQRSQGAAHSQTSVNQLSLFKKQRENNKKFKKQAEISPYLKNTFISNMPGALQAADPKENKVSQFDQSYQRHDTDSPLIKSTRKYGDNKEINAKLQIAFANKLMLKDFGTDESTDIMSQLGNIHLPEMNRGLNQQTALNGQIQRQGDTNLLDLLKSKFCRSTQDSEMKPLYLNPNPSTPTLQFQNTEQAEKQLQSQQLNKPKYPFNSPGKLLGIQLSPLYRHRKNMNYQISCDRIDSPNDTESKSRADSPIIFSRVQNQFTSLLSNNLLSEVGTPINTCSHHLPPSQPAIQIHPPVQSNFHLDTAQNFEQVPTSQLLKSNLLIASTPQFSKIAQIEQQTSQEQKQNTQNYNYAQSNVRNMEEYLNCVHNAHNNSNSKKGENDSQEKNYDIRLVECRWEGQKSIMVIMNNINERLMRQRLLQIEKYKDSVIDTISHNLKTPLNCMLAPLECVKTQLESQIKIEKSEDQKELFATESLKHVGMAINNCQLLLSMINDLIDYSQIIKGDCSFRLEIAHFKLSSVVKALRMLFEDQMQSKKIEFVITSLVPLGEIILFHDERRLLQILVNLISNSLKYTFKGKIELIIDNPSKEFAALPMYSLSNSPTTSKFKNKIKRLPIQSENLLRFILIDTGIGMSTQNLHHLKDLLFKKKHLVSNSRSSGLGLTMCFTLIEQVGYQGISPEIQSQEDVGTRFSFTIQQIYKLSNPKMDQLIRPPLSQQVLDKKVLPPHLLSGSVIGTNSPVCQEYQSSSILGSKQDSFELPKINQPHQNHQHPSTILSQYNFSHLHTKSTLEHTLRKESSLEHNSNNINMNSSLSKQLEKQIHSNPKDHPECYTLSKDIQNNDKNEHILESSCSEEEKKDTNLKNIQQQPQQYLLVQPTVINLKSCGTLYSSQINNKDQKSLLQVGQNCSSNQGTDREIPSSRKNSSQYFAKKSIQLQQQSIIFSPSARSDLSRDPASFYSSIAQRHTILFGKERKNSESDNLDESSVVNGEELMQDQLKEKCSTKYPPPLVPPLSPSIYRQYRHHTDQSYGNSCDCVQEEDDEIGQKEDKEKAMSVSLEIRRKPFMTFGNRDLLQVESEFMQRSQDYSNTERVSEEKSHITTQKYNIVQSASKGNGFTSQKITDSQKSLNGNLRWMLPHLETEQNIDETIEMILAGKHILIVDDTIYNIMMLRILIRNVKDLKIEEAYNGKDALEKFQTHAISNVFFDFIFMDIEMPIMDGLECIKNIREFELANDHKPTTIISVTAYDRDLQEVLLAGADGLIAKPIRKDKFLQTLRFLSANNHPKNTSNMMQPLSL